MRPQKVLDKDILTALTKTFRSKGYEGASLKALSEATGLKKASLYHRFPDGKQEMANAVLNYLDSWVAENIFQTLLDANYTPSERLIKGLEQIKTLYNGGQSDCIFMALSMEDGLELFEEQVNNGMKEWISTFEKVGISLGLANAQEEATQTLVQIQGSLIVSKGLDDISVFDKTLKNIENRYLKA